MYKLRLAKAEELTDIKSLITECQALLNARGVDQWQDGYPTLEVLNEDIEKQRGYILEIGGRIAAYGAIIYDVEPAYLNIKGGEWLSNYQYATLHRLAVPSAFRGQGIGAKFFAAMECEATDRGIRSLRADTHKDNMVMQRLLARLGFVLCGDVYYDTSHRLAFEKIIE